MINFSLVVNSAPRPIRARNAQEKALRRSDILKAADKLWLQSNYHELSMNEVAREAKLAKGTLYLYFKTKEELFLALLESHLEQWLGDLRLQLEARPSLTSKEVTDLLADSALAAKRIRSLMVLLGTVLDQRVSQEVSLGFRYALRRHVTDVVRFMPFDEEVSLRILVHLYALAVGWQQVAELKSGIRAHNVLPTLDVPSRFDHEFAMSFRSAVDMILAEETKQ